MLWCNTSRLTTSSQLCAEALDSLGHGKKAAGAPSVKIPASSSMDVPGSPQSSSVSRLVAAIATLLNSREQRIQQQNGRERRILPNGNTPSKVMVHMTEIIPAVGTMNLKEGNTPNDRPCANDIDSCNGQERFVLAKPLPLIGRVEIYLQDVITKESMPGVFTATLKVMIDVDEQPAVDCISLDESVINLLSCFAKCYGKGHAQNRRGIIQFASSKVSRFRTFVTLRFSIATRSLSYISKPLSICNDPNFW